MLTERKIQKLPPKDKRYSVALGDGLSIRIYPSGSKTWLFRFYEYGTVRDLTLGKYPDLSLAQVRQIVRRKRAELKLSPSKGISFGYAFKLWKKKKRKLKTYKKECQLIKLHLLPALGTTALDDITAPRVIVILAPLENKLPTLRHVLMRLNEILELAVCAGLIAQNPCRKLSKIFAPHTPAHRPYIPADELKNFFILFKDEPLWLQLYALFSTYSLLRPIEVSSIRWDWIEDGILTIPAEKMKMGRTHRVPLCKDIVKILEMIKSLITKRSSYVWAFGRGDHINKQYLSTFILKTPLKGKLCHHGLRATSRTWLKSQGIEFHIAEDALAHTSGDVTVRAYLRDDYLEERKEIMQRWWQFIYSEYCAVCAPFSWLEQDNSAD